MHFGIRACDVFSFALLSQDDFGNSRSFVVPCEFQDFFSLSLQNTIGILIRVTWILQITLGSMDILTILSFPIHERWVSFQLFVSSFINILQFSGYKYFTYLVKFISTHFIIFDAIVNEIIFLISFLDSSLLVYRNETNFYMLILYSATSINIISNLFLVESSRITTYKIISSATEIILLLTF